MRRLSLLSLSVACLLSTSPTVTAQSSGTKWALKMFTEKDLKHDFGKVASGSKVHHIFYVENKYKETIRISSVSSSCGCALPKIVTASAASKEKAVIRVDLDTIRHKGQKAPVMTVTFDKPYPAVVKIPMRVYIRSDIVLDPDAVKFGVIPQGKGFKQTLKINYAGRNDWKITGAKTTNKYLQAKVEEKSRQFGAVSYELTVLLSSQMPAGKLQELVILETDDRNAKTFPVQVEGRIDPEFSVAPAKLTLGEMRPGTDKRLTIVVRGKKPFTVADVTCGGQKVKARLIPRPAKAHLISLTITPPDKPGRFDEELLVRITGREQPLRLRAYGQVVN